MSQYPYTGPYSSQNQPSTLNTGTGVGSTGLGTGTGYGTTGLGTTGLGTGTGYSTGVGTTGLGTGLQTGYSSTDPHYIPSSTTGTQNIQNQPIIKRKHRPQSRSSSSSSSSSNEEKRAKKGQKQGLGQKIKNIPAKVKEMVTGHHATDTTQPSTTNPNYPNV